MPVGRYAVYTDPTGTLGTAGNIVQEVYEQGLVAQLNQQTILSNRLQRNTEDFMGKKLVLAAHTKRGVGFSVSENLEMPPRSTQGSEQLKFDMVKIMQRMSLTQESLSRTKNAPKGAFVKALRFQLDGMRDDLKKENNRQLFGNRRGELAVVSSTITNGTGLQVQDSRFLREGAPVNIGTISAVAIPAAGTNNTISVVNSGTLVTLAVACSATTLVHALFWRHNDSGGTNTVIKGYDQFGLQTVCSTSDPEGGIDFGEINRATNFWWHGNVKHNGGTNRPLSTRLLADAINAPLQKEGLVPTLGITTYGLLLEYGTQLVADRRFGASAMVTLDGGWKALEFDGIPIVGDPDAPGNMIHFLYEPDLAIAVLEDWGFWQPDGSTLFRVNNYQEIEAVFWTMRNLVSRRNRSQVVLKDLTESNPAHTIGA